MSGKIQNPPKNPPAGFRFIDPGEIVPRTYKMWWGRRDASIWRYWDSSYAVGSVVGETEKRIFITPISGKSAGEQKQPNNKHHG